jgi:hypothetical protein
VHVRGRGIARGSGANHQKSSAGPGQDQGSGQPDGTPPMITTSYLCLQPWWSGSRRQQTLLLPGWAGWNWAVEDTTTAVAAAPDQVGPRLRQLRARRGVTLTALSEATSISGSTLTHLGAGQGRASLELLLRLLRRTGRPWTTSWGRQGERARPARTVGMKAYA